jgi:membrane protein YqaA with SNARE-associated domain
MKQKFMNMLNYLLKKNAMLGVFIGMFLESSCVPIPSEAVLLAFGTEVPVRIVVIAGTVGSTAGGIIGYYFIGKLGGEALVGAIGPYIDVDPKKVTKWGEKYLDTKNPDGYAAHAKKKYPGVPGWVFNTLLSPGAFVLLSRCIPFIPFKIFSISSGLIGIDFWSFVIFTFIGSIPRCYVLATIGHKLERYKKPVLLGLGALVLLYLAHVFIKAVMR